jgi:hypothetical protein
MNLYRVRMATRGTDFGTGAPILNWSDYQLLVVHHLGRLAKMAAFRVWPEEMWEGPAELRVHLVRGVTVPVEETAPRVIWSCSEAPWTCPAWDHELCGDCENRERSEDG